MPTGKTFRSGVVLPSLYTFSDKDYVYILPYYSKNENLTGFLPLLPDPYEAPEKNDPNFVAVTGRKTIRVNDKLVTENVLDMLHISFVHSFGNRDTPTPFRISFDENDKFSGKTTFHYKSGRESISRQIAGADVVTVENEYHLPSTTVTRVIAGDLVKVVVTRAFPVSESETVLFWEIYRNFWTGPLLTTLGDVAINYFMEQTLSEDISILKSIYLKHRVGTVVTKYDVTIQKFRQAVQKITTGQE
jgi:phenylpropionate dioxygenase-like ring-hydroxylating dioxygenase large terminal subunit